MLRSMRPFSVDCELPKMYITILILAAVTLVRGNDVAVGINTSRKIFDENRHASPAIWKQIDNVTISAEDNNVITGIFVTDQRPEKDGEVKIVDGGIGQQNVTLELKSPTVFRGYDFHVEVYTAPENQVKEYENNQESGSHSVENKPKSNADGIDANKQPSVIPPRTILEDTVKPESSTTKDGVPMFSDTKVNDNENKAENGAENITLKTNNPLTASDVLSKPAKTEENEQSRHTRDVENQSVTKETSTVPIATNENKSGEKQETKADIHTTPKMETENSSQQPSTIPREFAFSDLGLKINPISNVKHNDTADKDDNVSLTKAEGIVPPTSLASDKKPTSSNNWKRQSRDTTHEDNTKSVDDIIKTRNGATHPILPPSSYNTEVKTNSAPTEKSLATPKVNAGEFPNTNQKTESYIKFPSTQPLPYTLTTKMVSTTEKIQKRDTESKTSTEKDSEGENKFINVPKLVGAQNSTKYEQKPVISIQ